MPEGHARQSALRPSDVAVALRLARSPGLFYRDLATGLKLGVAEVHRGVRRLEAAGLLAAQDRRIHRQALLEFLVHGVRYAFPAMLGAAAPGVPTGWAAPVLAGALPGATAGEPAPLVWPLSDAAARGTTVLPLYPAAPRAALGDEWLYRTLALVDVLRVGSLGERRRAQNLLDETLSAAAAR